ncbi:MAG: AMP-binding protein [Azonexus sp.]|jgi:long-chain acyl-CoA synthetase|nr:AMP-binding protein [Azonexus sp.]
MHLDKQKAMPPVFPSVVHMLVDAAAKAPGHEALVCEDVRLNYEEYLRCVLGFAAELRREGVKGGRVAIVLGNSVDICIALLGAQMVGAQVALLNPLLTEYELLPLLTDIDAAAIIYTADKKALIEPLADRLGVHCRHCLAADAQTLTRWRSTSATADADDLPAQESLALLLYTGGTTGVPKGVDLTHSALAHGVAQLNSLIPARPDQERLLCATPLCHIYSIFVGLNNMLYRRGTLVILPRYSADGVLDAMAAEAITILAGGPTMLVGLLANESLPQRRFPHLRFSYSGASALPAETLHRFERATGAPVLEGYGQTETGGGVVFNPLEGEHKPGSVGVPLVGVEVEIVDTALGTEVLPTGEAGEIRLRGPQLMRGYRGLPEETAAVWRNGWLYTTDIGYFDSDGYLYISDRKKDMVIVSGFNVYPRAVEEVLYQHPDIIEASVIGVGDAYQGEALKAFVTVRPGKQLSADEITRHCRSHLAPYKVPRQIEFVDALPKTAVGKIDKMRLRKWGMD